MVFWVRIVAQQLAPVLEAPFSTGDGGIPISLRSLVPLKLGQSHHDSHEQPALRSSSVLDLL